MELNTEVVIAAPVEEVWRILTDFGAYSEWNPLITKIAGEARPGCTLEVEISLPEGNSSTFRPAVLVVTPNRELRWRGKLGFPWLFQGEHFFKLEPSGSGTRFIHGEHFSGVLVKFMGRTLTQTARGFVYMNQALKRHAEQTA